MRISERISEQSEVTKVTQIPSEDWNLQRTVEQALLKIVEAVKNHPSGANF